MIFAAEPRFRRASAEPPPATPFRAAAATTAADAPLTPPRFPDAFMITAADAPLPPPS
jgi:hypothetical protein